VVFCGIMVIALITDFGTKDYFVGAMKGVIFTINPNANIIDITHEIPPHDVQSAGFALGSAYKNFPEKTIFVAVVDPGVGSNRRPIVVETPKYKFVAPDNGLLSFIFNFEKDFRVFRIDNDELFLKPISKTFHGRDIFAPVATHLSMGVKPELVGSEIKDFIKFDLNSPQTIANKRIEGQIIHIDYFGNLVTNLKLEDLPEKFELKIRDQTIKKLSQNYSEAGKGELLLILGSAGFYEVAANQSSAKDILRAVVNDIFTVDAD
jgi:S-adenosyl-L-methionine hydrolase (adenosine-forming)